MNTLREAVREYLEMRRALGFKLREAGKGLDDFVRFMERRKAPYITQEGAVVCEFEQTCKEFVIGCWRGCAFGTSSRSCYFAIEHWLRGAV